MKKYNLLVCCLLLSTPLFGFDSFAPPKGLDPVHVRVVWNEDPQHTATISWTTGNEASVNQLNYGEKKSDLSRHQKADLNGVFTFSAHKKRKGAIKPFEMYYHHVNLKGLSANTVYYFQVKSDGHASKEFYFRTAPELDEDFKILSGGDSRSDGDSLTGLNFSVQINKKIASIVELDDTVLAFAHGGDFVFHGSDDLDEWNDWLFMFEDTYASDGRILPIIPTRGNHEARGVIYGEVFNQIGDKNNYFVTYLSPQVSLITLNSNIPTAGDQKIFLEEALKANQGKRWQLVQYHRPAYPAVKKPGAALQNWVPLFEKYKVPLVMESDGHALKRTVPIVAGKHVEGGVVYVGEGGLGVKQRTSKDYWYLKPPGMSMAAHHVQVISFSKSKLVYKAIGLDGKVLDEYVIQK